MTQKEKSTKPLLKMLLIGNSQVGKSCLLKMFCDNEFSFDVISTVGVDFRNMERDFDGETVKVQIWDTAGQEKFRTITSNYYRNAQGVAVIYDVTNEESFNQVNVWFEEIKKNAPEYISTVLLGNKVDLEDERVVTKEQGENLAKQNNCPYFEVSAKSGVNVDTAFNKLMDSSYEKLKKFGKPKTTNTVNFKKGKDKKKSCC
ncbi:ras and ef-hand domain-containing protein [Anaeramoeba flamelloides]|uniref:Ras and ef-hand domain-containing protein n=2 Tax=Anaeramoeba flamelloides TaxID=1746091 RepID=A0ABQ8Z6M6_9EUKA|nr:ras and ef-hand domain-containing protein [Anaeramoeba flamelloides]